MESVARVGILAGIGVMAGAASFTHMHDWTMQALPHGTADWFGWANAVASELMPTCALLEIRRKRRAGGSITYPVTLLVASGLLSLGAQVSQAGDSLTSKGLAALPAVAFMLLVKLVFSGLPHGTPATEPASRHDAPGRPDHADAGDHRGDRHSLVEDGARDREEHTDPRQGDADLAQPVPTVPTTSEPPHQPQHGQALSAPAPVAPRPIVPSAPVVAGRVNGRPVVIRR
ncbi:DUF2637 domain-containing protein [Actinocatenispora thailandica]|uniref:DUF2637 domain-containing protein n=1 Tax=Actinocatenispora thailandica TaxID=227318 RepID=UPI001952518B|nr:DUF2637 domain-containing protein [Actinocatenispora thailandica]